MSLALDWEAVYRGAGGLGDFFGLFSVCLVVWTLLKKNNAKSVTPWKRFTGGFGNLGRRYEAFSKRGTDSRPPSARLRQRRDSEGNGHSAKNCKGPLQPPVYEAWHP